MNRRELLKMIAAATGTAMVGDALAYVDQMPAATTLKDSDFSKADFATLEAVCETIIPRTETPGATDAGVAVFIVGYVTDCYTEEQQTTFLSGLSDIATRSKTETGTSFVDMSAEQQFEWLSKVDEAATSQTQAGGEPHYFTLLKQTTLFAFFSSEAGATQVLRHVETPGYYDGALPYKKGDRAWA